MTPPHPPPSSGPKCLNAHLLAPHDRGESQKGMAARRGELDCRVPSAVEEDAASICRIGTLFGARLRFFSHSVRWCTARFALADAIGFFLREMSFFAQKTKKSVRWSAPPEKQTRPSHRAQKTGWTCPNLALGRVTNLPAKRSYGTPRLRSQTLLFLIPAGFRCVLNRIQGTQNSTQEPILSLSLHQQYQPRLAD